MRALHFIGPGRLEWHDTPAPQLDEPGAALVRPIAVALCDADVASLRGELPAAGPYPFGHEFVAEVIRVGDDVKGFRPGERVVLPVQISCGACARCRSGKTAFCTSVRQPAAWGLGALGGNWPGALADLVRVPFAQHMMVALPPEVETVAAASVGDNLADAWRTVVPPLREAPAARVLVVGHGSIGLFAVAIAVASGASRVDYLDTDPARGVVATTLGATVIDARAGPSDTYPIVVDASFDSAGLHTALRAVATCGICTSVFPGLGEAAIPAFDMWRRAVRLHTGVANCRNHMDEVLELIVSGGVRPERVISEIIPWEDADRALAVPSLKPVVVRGDVGDEQGTSIHRE
jgi:threonine dehydrogenase-like Zn-dependent dehydrogenase